MYICRPASVTRLPVYCTLCCLFRIGGLAIGSIIIGLVIECSGKPHQFLQIYGADGNDKSLSVSVSLSLGLGILVIFFNIPMIN